MGFPSQQSVGRQLALSRLHAAIGVLALSRLGGACGVAVTCTCRVTGPVASLLVPLGRVVFGATWSVASLSMPLGRVFFAPLGRVSFGATGSRLFRRHCTGSRLFRRHWVAWSRSSPPSLTLVQGVASLWSMESKIKHNKYNIYNAHSYYYYCFAFYLSRLGPRGFLLGSFCLNIR